MSFNFLKTQEIENRKFNQNSCDVSEFKYIYDNKYEYLPEIVMEVNNGKVFDIAPNHEIDPLKTITLHCAGFLPSEVENDRKPLKAVITVNGEKFEQIIR